MEHFEELSKSISLKQDIEKAVNQLVTVKLGYKSTDGTSCLTSKSLYGDEFGLKFLEYVLTKDDIKRAIESLRRSAMKSLKIELNKAEKELEAYAIKKK